MTNWRWDQILVVVLTMGKERVNRNHKSKLIIPFHYNRQCWYYTEDKSDFHSNVVRLGWNICCYNMPKTTRVSVHITCQHNTSTCWGPVSWNGGCRIWVQQLGLKALRVNEGNLVLKAAEDHLLCRLRLNFDFILICIAILPGEKSLLFR